jgi:hypothetical protein
METSLILTIELNNFLDDGQKLLRYADTLQGKQLEDDPFR